MDRVDVRSDSALIPALTLCFIPAAALVMPHGFGLAAM
jgi:hypothetical protein